MAPNPLVAVRAQGAKIKNAEQEIERKKAQCLAREGGEWDEEKQICRINNKRLSGKRTDIETLKERSARVATGAPAPTTQQSAQGPQFDTGEPQSAQSSKGLVVKSEQGQAIGFTNSQGEFIEARGEELARNVSSGFTTEQVAQQQNLSGQVGEFSELGLGTDGGIDLQQSAIVGVTNSIPSALRLAGQAGIGAAAIGGIATAPAGGIGAVPAGLIGGVIGLTAGLTAGIISESKAQRSDTLTAQQRVLDEGKQTLNDWATMAAADPANKEKYLTQYNITLSQINQAYRKMKRDTSHDVLKFNTALPNLAEFETFYSLGGERDALNSKMATSMQSVASPEFEFLSLENRRNP